MWNWLSITSKNGDPWRYWGFSTYQHTERLCFLACLCGAPITANQRQDLLFQMVHSWEEEQPQEQGWWGGQICQFEYQDLFHLPQLDTSGSEDEWVWDYCTCWPWLGHLLEDLHSWVLAKFFLNIINKLHMFDLVYHVCSTWILKSKKFVFIYFQIENIWTSSHCGVPSSDSGKCIWWHFIFSAAGLGCQQHWQAFDIKYPSQVL